MKRIVIVLLAMVLMAGGAWAGSTTFTGDSPSGSCITSYCEICDKQLIEWKESTYSTDESTLVWSGGGMYCQGEHPRAAGRVFEHILCLDCYKKYWDKYHELMTRTDKEFYNKARAENTTTQDVNQRKRKSEALKRLLEEIEKLKGKIKALEIN